MIKLPQLEDAVSLQGFGEVVSRLLEAPTSDKAFYEAQTANRVSSNLMGSYERKHDSGTTSVEDLNDYNELIGRCLRKFLVMLKNPELNGQRYHLSLFFEQMGGRRALANGFIYRTRNYKG